MLKKPNIGDKVVYKDADPSHFEVLGYKIYICIYILKQLIFKYNEKHWGYTWVQGSSLLPG